MYRSVFSFIFLVCTLLLRVPAFAQTGYVPLNDQFSNNLTGKLYNKNFRFHTSIRPYNYREIEKVVNVDSLRSAQRRNRVFAKSWKQKVWDKLFNDDAISLYKKDFTIQANPLMNFSAGYDATHHKKTWVNTRGFEIKGTLGKGLVFYTRFYENQAVFPEYLSNYVKDNLVVPGQGRIHVLLDNTGQHYYLDGKAFDYSMADGYVAWQTGKYVSFQFGHGKNFYGDGYRSLLLSDNSTANLFFKFSLDVWHLKYQVLLNQYLDIRDSTMTGGYARKFSAIHYLSWAISKRVSLSLFDAVVWSATDNQGQYRGFDFQYLNPMIFLRPVEFSIGSPDNALVGFNMSVIVGDHNVLYGQLLLDEFNLKNVLYHRGYWTNKQAVQLGFKAYDLFKIKNLYFQTEFNNVPPYTYSEREEIINYGAYNQPLADPFGANFRESVNFLRYNYKRFYFSYELLYSIYGTDPPGKNYGGDIYKSYLNHVSDYGNYIGQGIRNRLLYQDIRASYLINPRYNLNFTLGAVFRNLQTEGVGTTNTAYIYFGIRTSLRNLYYDF
ncbi:MAG: hypothetical protein JXR71_07670 [Bacteroidales bacterium]|nr:hypothetical protein [Bacteroidales bacterium]